MFHWYRWCSACTSCSLSVSTSETIIMHTTHRHPLPMKLDLFTHQWSLNSSFT